MAETMVEIDEAKMMEDFESFRDENVADLDDICAALYAFQEKRPHPVIKGGRVVPNRVIALAAVRLMEAWELAVWSHE
jgi:hypothetical protein